ncbi:MAG: DUF3267 domain-containing protein [Allobaculum sp.]
MRLHYKKQFNGDVDSLPKHEHEPGAVKFKEINDFKKLSIILNAVSIVLMIGLVIIDYLVFKNFNLFSIPSLIGIILSLVVLFPHELLHAVCFKEDVELYTALDKGMLFVTGTETFSKAHFIWMSLCPNIVFGFIPWILGLTFQNWIGAETLVALGTIAIAMGIGDYYNVLHALTQMPKGSRCYMYGMNTYWYMPKSHQYD